MHGLVVGGTGMLRGVVLWLARRGWDATVIARTAAPELPGRARLVPADYRVDAALRHALDAAVAAQGPIDLAVSWVHSDAPRAPTIVAGALGPGARHFRVLGCEAAAPDAPPAETGPDLRRIILGFMIQGRASRWLTHDEIAAGVINAIERDKPESVIGVVRPWGMRPAL